MKLQRFYEIINNILYIYDKGDKNKSISVSMVSINDFKYYKYKFKLTKIWSN